MKYLGKRALALALAVCVLVSAGSALTFEEKMQQSEKLKIELENALAEAEKQKEENEKRKLEIEQSIQELSKETADLVAYIQETDLELNDMALKKAELELMIEEAEKQLENRKAEQLQAEENCVLQYDTMKKRVKYMYENGDTNILEIFLQSDNLSDFLNRAEYIKQITKYDNSLLERYELAVETAETARQAAEAELSRLNGLKEGLEIEILAYQELAAEKGALLEEYMEKMEITEVMLEKCMESIEDDSESIDEIIEREKKRLEDEEEIKREEEERLALEAEVRRLEAERLAAIEAAKKAAEEAAKKAAEEEKKRAEEEAAKKAEEAKNYVHGKLNAAKGIELTDITDVNQMIWPLPGDGRIYSKFGYRKAPTAGASTYHKGVDIGGSYGADIVSVLAGKVTTASYSATNGNYIRVDHGNGVVTAYVHCSKLLVKKGDYVKQGQVIALCGSTGISTGPHLHFGVIINGTFVDPLLYIDCYYIKYMK